MTTEVKRAIQGQLVIVLAVLCAAGLLAAGAAEGALVTAGLQVWLDGSDAGTLYTDVGGTSQVVNTNDPVALWKDKATATPYSVSQGNAAQRPKYITAGQGGRSVVRFDGGDDLLKNTAYNWPAGFEVFAVVMNNTWNVGSENADYDYILAANGLSPTTSVGLLKTGLTFQDWSDHSLLGFAEGYGTGNAPRIAAKYGALAAGAWVVTDWRLGSAEAAVALNGATLTPDAAVAGANTGADAQLYVGSNGAGSQLWNGDMAEVLVYDHILTSAERTQVTNYLNNKWFYTDPLTTAVAVWRFTSDGSDSNGPTLSNLAVNNTATAGQTAASFINARNSDNKVLDSGAGYAASNTGSFPSQGWAGILSPNAELYPILNTSLSVFARVRWTGQFNDQPQSGTDVGVDDIIRFGNVSNRDKDWYALQLRVPGSGESTTAYAQFVTTGKGNASENAVVHGSPLSLNTWYDITGVFDSATQMTTIYVYDPQTGLAVGTPVSLGVGYSSLENLSANLLLFVTASFTNGPQPGAQMDLAALWMRALSAEEVAGLSAVPEPSTFALLVGTGAMALAWGWFRRRRAG